MDKVCWQCAERAIGCHAVCEKYLAYRKELDDKNAEKLRSSAGEYRSKTRERNLHALARRQKNGRGR